MKDAPLKTQQITQRFEDKKSQEYLQMGTKLEGRYLIEGILGRGGMGAVYIARDLRFTVKKHVAVKEMINQASDEETSARIIKNFEREANVLATVNHPAIPTIYDYFTLDTRSYLVMEWIKGKNLETIIEANQGFIAEQQVVTWALDICEVLHYLHTHTPEPIVFRDIKPANIMITPKNKIVLVDFGIAKTFQTGEKGTMIGTEGYSPPEQYRGKATPQVDIYAMGATLHHILTKSDPRTEPPFTFNERPIQRYNPHVSVELEAVINTALQYNAADRFPSANVMREALVSAARKTGLLINNNLDQVTQIYQERSPLWTFKCEDEVRGSPLYHEGTIYVGAYDNNLYALDASTGEFIWKYATEGGIAGKPTIYEEKLFFGSADQCVHAISSRSGNNIWTHKTDGSIFSSPYAAEQHIFIGSDDEHLYVLNTRTGRLAWRMNGGSKVRSSPLIVGDKVYFGTEGGEVYCVDFSGNTQWHTTAKRAFTASPHFANGVIYIPSLDGVLYAIDAKTGWIIWRFRMNKGSISTPITDANHVFLGATDGHMYCINIKSSQKAWSFPTEAQINGSPIFYKDAIYFGSTDSKIYSLEAKNGNLRWEYATKGPITGTPVIHEDILYIGSNDHHIYALPA
ncbi:MAG: protein kinase [Chloroflexota bacterium]|nr:MAG: protein kinase [Chloroflexota bacterium]